MNFENKTIVIKDGRKCILRPTVPDDAQSMIEYLKIISEETEFVLRNADEVHYTEENERALLQAKLDSPNELMMVAEIDGENAGNCSIGSRGGLRRIKHRCGFAIALKKSYWNLGIGTAMIKYALELAEKMGYEQTELEVVDGNDRAKTLYEKAGFEVTGKHLRALKYDDGSYRDEYIMVKILK